jgi:hypothetical protein
VAAGRFPSEIVVRERAGWRVTATGGAPVFVGRRQEHLYGRARAGLTVDGTGGMSVRIDSRHAMDLEYEKGIVRAVAAVGGIRHGLGERPACGELEVELRLLPAEGHQFSAARGPDRVVAGVVAGDEFVKLGELDGRYISTEVAGGMTGRMLGIFCGSGDVLVRSFEYVGADDPAAARG